MSVWLSVDPLADQYPSLSPYNYCSNNPIIFYDPDGKFIHILGTEAAAAFVSLLCSYSGVNANNMEQAFSITGTDHVYSARALSYKEFKNNFNTVTGQKHKGKDLLSAWCIHLAAASTETLEVAAFTGNSGSFSNQQGQIGTSIIPSLEGYKPSDNYNPDYQNLIEASYNNASPEEINTIYDKIITEVSGSNWKLIPYNGTAEQRRMISDDQVPNKGTVVINGNIANSVQTQSSAILDAIKKVPLKLNF